jgi:hypothetical protein
MNRKAIGFSFAGELWLNMPKEGAPTIGAAQAHGAIV